MAVKVCGERMQGTVIQAVSTPISNRNVPMVFQKSCIETKLSQCVFNTDIFQHRRLVLAFRIVSAHRRRSIRLGCVSRRSTL